MLLSNQSDNILLHSPGNLAEIDMHSDRIIGILWPGVSVNNETPIRRSSAALPDPL